jgi:hypothetical protein
LLAFNSSSTLTIVPLSGLAAGAVGATSRRTIVVAEARRDRRRILGRVFPKCGSGHDSKPQCVQTGPRWWSPSPFSRVRRCRPVELIEKIE